MARSAGGPFALYRRTTAPACQTPGAATCTASYLPADKDERSTIPTFERLTLADEGSSSAVRILPQNRNSVPCNHRIA
jgi:hypothetical protein